MKYKMFKKEYEGKYLHYFYYTEGNYTSIIGLHKWFNNEYGYFEMDINNRNLDMSDIEQSIHQKISFTNEFDDEGSSLRGPIEDIVHEVKDFIPNIKNILEQIDDEMFVFN